MQRAARLQRLVVSSTVLLVLLVFPLCVWGQGPGDNVLFEDDFSTYSSRWLERDTPKATVAYGDEMLLLRVVSPGVGVWSVPDFQVTLADYDLQTTIIFREGGADAQAGVVLAYEDDEDFLALLVTRAGAWQLMRFDSGTWIDLTPDDAAPVEREDANETLVLRVELFEDTLTVWIDEQPSGAVSVTEDDRPGAGFGLLARAGLDYVDVAFDDVVVREVEVTEESAS